MELSDRIDSLIDKKVYLIDIFPKTVPHKTDNRYFAVEKYFHQNRSEFERKLITIILKLYCYYDFIVNSEDKITENPTIGELTMLLEKCFRGEFGNINIVLPEYDAMISLNNNDLYMTAYNVSSELQELIAQLVNAEGMFFYEAPLNNFGEE